MLASAGTATHPRTNIVLVPGFVGFDALGQLSYYAGVTEVFQAWKREADVRDAAIHYFDNFPTASVELRAQRLLKFLAKKLVRGEFASADRVVLVGHSTGALDIRRLLHVLTVEDPAGSVTTDGNCQILHADILTSIKRLCFLSAPHFGTNIADFAYALRDTAQVALRSGALGVQLNRDPVSTTRRLLTKHLAESRSGLVLAIADALNESDEYIGKTTKGAPKSSAGEREARSQFALWLEHMSKEFDILNDLRSGAIPREPTVADKLPSTPAHFSEQQRRDELASWDRLGISTRSYATLVPGSAERRNPLLAPLIAALRAGAPLLNVVSDALTEGSHFYLAPLVAGLAFITQISLPAVPAAGVLAVLNAHPELLFELFCMLCADGPFQSPSSRWPNALSSHVTDFHTGLRVNVADIKAAESDGVVNTLSMFWPPSDPQRPDMHTHFLVQGDHGEIIGHYAPKKVPAPSSAAGRRYFAYDFFQSRSPFNEVYFQKVWRHLFEFCVEPSASAVSSPA